MAKRKTPETDEAASDKDTVSNEPEGHQGRVVQLVPPVPREQRVQQARQERLARRESQVQQD